MALKLHVNRWRCRNRCCSVRFFTRSLVGVVEAYARETNRARDLTLLIGHALGGLPGQRLMSRFNMATSDDTILRRLRHLPREPVSSEVRVIGVDEWAWSRGQTFGTILVDLERGHVVDVLAESSADALAAWLTAHPGVTTISRDRHGRYAEGARRAVPDAMQVADRFHLVRNLRQAVERELALHRRDLRVSLPSQTVPAAKPQGEKNTKQIRVCSQVVEHRQEGVEQWRQEKLKLFETIRQMKAAGMKVSEIAGHLGINRRRIDKWVRLAEFPERSRMDPRPGMVESFREYLRERWEQGCPPWPGALGGNPATGLHRLLHAACPVALAVAPAEARIGSSESHPTADITGPGSERAIGATDFTTGSRRAAEQTAAGFDRPASRDRRCSERTVPGLCGNAEADFWLSRHPAPRQGNNVAWMVGGSAADRNPRDRALCPDGQAGPRGGRVSRDGEMEQRAGGKGRSIA